MKVLNLAGSPYASLTIQKIDSVTSKGIAGVKFHIIKANGEYIGDFTTDNWGQIKLSKTLTPDTYIIEEISTLDGYKLDETIQKVELNWGDNKIVQVKNNPYGSLKIVKIDKDTRKVLSGVKYKLTNEDEYNQYLGNSFFKINKDIILLHKNYSSLDIFDKTEKPIYFTINVKSDYGLRFSYDKSKIIKVNNIEVNF